jgi:hypothetical protein
MAHTLRHPNLKALKMIWDLARKGQRLPSSFDFFERDLSVYEANLIVVDVQSGGDRFRYESIGRALSSYVPENYVGLFVDEIPNRLFRTLAGRAYAEVCKAMAPSQAQFIFARDRWFGWYERLLLPLSDDGAAVTTVVTGIYPTIKRKPQGFEEQPWFREDDY